MINKSLPVILKYAILSSNNDVSDFMDITEIDKNPSFYFSVKTLKGLMNSLLDITYNNDIDTFKEIYNVTELVYEKAGGDKKHLPFIAASKLTQSSRELNSFYLFLAEKTEDIFSFVNYLDDHPSNFFSLFLKYQKFDIATILLDKYDIKQSLPEDNILDFNNNASLPLYHPKEQFVPFAESVVLNSLLKPDYLNRQLLVLASLKSIIGCSIHENERDQYWNKLIEVTGEITPQEQDFLLCWIIKERKNGLLLKKYGTDKGMMPDIHSGKALYEACYLLSDEDSSLFDFIQPYISDLTNNAEKHNIILCDEWIKRHPIWERTQHTLYFGQVKNIEQQANKIYEFLYPDTDIKFDFYKYKDHFLEDYKSFYYKDNYTPEQEKSILNGYFEIDHYFESMKGLVIEEPRKIKRL